MKKNKLDQKLNEINQLLKNSETLRKNFLLTESFGVDDNFELTLAESVEKYFIDNKEKICGFHFDCISKGIGEVGVFELDFLLVNNDTIGLVEVKRNLRVSDIDSFFIDTVPKFKKYYDKYYKNKKRIYIFACRDIKDNLKDIDDKLNYYKIREKLILKEKAETQFEQL